MGWPLKKILVVDDDELISEFVDLVLTASNYDVCKCGSGNEALEKIIPFRPQLILLDVLMPEMDGIQTYEAFRQMPEAVSVPVIFLTGKASAENRQDYEQMGALGLISKPIIPDSLCRSIETMWEQHNA